MGAALPNAPAWAAAYSSCSKLLTLALQCQPTQAGAGAEEAGGEEAGGEGGHVVEGGRGEGAGEGQGSEGGGAAGTQQGAVGQGRQGLCQTPGPGPGAKAMAVAHAEQPWLLSCSTAKGAGTGEGRGVRGAAGAVSADGCTGDTQQPVLPSVLFTPSVCTAAEAVQAQAVPAVKLAGKPRAAMLHNHRLVPGVGEEEVTEVLGHMGRLAQDMRQQLPRPVMQALAQDLQQGVWL